MKLEFIGTNHCDPLGRRRLEGHLAQLRDKYSSRPAFIACECSSSWVPTIQIQRRRLSDDLRREWLIDQADLLTVLSESIFYEIDTHKEIFAEVPMVWLDENRQGMSPDLQQLRLEGLASGWRCHWETFYGNHPPPYFLESFLLPLSRSVWALPPSERPVERDTDIAQTILDALVRYSGSWSLAIVGAGHVDEDVPQSSLSLVRARGHECLPLVLSTTFPVVEWVK
jgi:hypothetical protein